jgi:hypothetical protein
MRHGILEVVVAGAFLAALPRAGVGRGLAALTALAVASAGIGSVNAFLHPLPYPRHLIGLALIPVMPDALHCSAFSAAHKGPSVPHYSALFRGP